MNIPSPDTMTLDELFSEAKQLLRDSAKKRKAAVAAPSVSHFVEENWKTARFVALIHQESQTLLGTFAEQRNPWDETALRWKRADEETPVAVEYVSGIWSSPKAAARTFKAEVADQVHFVTCSITLSLGECEAICLVRVVLNEYAVRSATLQQPVCFSGRYLLELPAGTELFPRITHESKLAIRKAISCL